MAEADGTLVESEGALLDAVGASGENDSDSLKIFMEPTEDGCTNVFLSSQTARFLCGITDSNSPFDYEHLTAELTRILGVAEIACITIRDSIEPFPSEIPLGGMEYSEPLLSEQGSESLMYNGPTIAASDNHAPQHLSLRGDDATPDMRAQIAQRTDVTADTNLRLDEELSEMAPLAQQFNNSAGSNMRSNYESAAAQRKTQTLLGIRDYGASANPISIGAAETGATWNSIGNMKPIAVAQPNLNLVMNSSVSKIRNGGRVRTRENVGFGGCKFTRCHVLEHETTAHARCHLRSLEFRCERCEFAATTWRRIKKHLALDHFDAQLAAFCAACREYFLTDSPAGQAFIAQHARTCRFTPPDITKRPPPVPAAIPTSRQPPKTANGTLPANLRPAQLASNEEVITVDLPAFPSSGSNTFRCQYVGCEFRERGFSTMAEKTTHEQCHESATNGNQAREELEAGRNEWRYRCPHCSGGFTTTVWNVMRNHLWERHSVELGTLLRCSICTFRCVFSEQLRAHFKALHGRSVRVRTRTAPIQVVWPSSTRVTAAAADQESSVGTESESEGSNRRVDFEFRVPMRLNRSIVTTRPVAVQFSVCNGRQEAEGDSEADAEANRRYCCSWSGCFNSVPLRALATRTERDLHERCHAASTHVRLFRCALCDSARGGNSSASLPTGNWLTIRAHLIDTHGLVFVDADSVYEERRLGPSRLRPITCTSSAVIGRTRSNRPVEGEGEAELSKLSAHLPAGTSLKRLRVLVRDVLRSDACKQLRSQFGLQPSDYRISGNREQSARDTLPAGAGDLVADPAMIDAMDDEEDETEAQVIAVTDEQDVEAYEDEPLDPPTDLKCRVAADCPFSADSELSFIDVCERDTHERCHQLQPPRLTAPRSPMCTVSFSCDQPDCSFFCRFWRTLKCHRFLEHREAVGVLACRVCSSDTELRFFSNLKFNQHFRSSEHVAAAASTCQRRGCLSLRMADEAEVRAHLDCHRPDSLSFHCSETDPNGPNSHGGCDFTCDSWQRMRWHLSTVHGVQIGRFYECAVCGQQTHNRALLRVHSCKAPAETNASSKRNSQKNLTSASASAAVGNCSDDEDEDDDGGSEADLDQDTDVEDGDEQERGAASNYLCSVKDCYHQKYSLHDEAELRMHESCHIKHPDTNSDRSAFVCCYEKAAEQQTSASQKARCSFSCRSWQRMRAHLLNDHRVATGRLFSCAEPGCAARFLDTRSLEKHLATRHTKHERKLYCKYAACAYNTLRYSLKHADEAAHHERSHDLYAAAHSDGAKITLDEADDVAHGSSAQAGPHFRCLKCEHDEAQWFQAVAHMWTAHNFDAGLYRCSVAGCDFRTLRRRELFDHANVHAGRQFACSLGCGRTFSLERQARSHASRFCALIAAQMVDGRVPECTTCHRGFKTRALLRHHQRTVHGDDAKRFTCEKCGAIIKHRQNYRAHLRSHDVSKYRKCDYCEYRTPKVALLNAHVQRKHTGCRFVCGYCEQGAYATPYDLKQHLIRKHPGQNVVLRCPSCSYSNVLEANLSNHIRLQHPDLFLQINIPLTGSSAGTIPSADQPHASDPSTGIADAECDPNTFVC